MPLYAPPPPPPIEIPKGIEHYDFFVRLVGDGNGNEEDSKGKQKLVSPPKALSPVGTFRGTSTANEKGAAPATP